jgi:hypothetical protein
MYTIIPWSFAYIYHAKAPVGYLTARQLHTYHNCQTVRIRLKRLHKHTKYIFSLFLGLTSDKSTILCYLHTASCLLHIMAAHHTSPCSFPHRAPCRLILYPGLSGIPVRTPFSLLSIVNKAVFSLIRVTRYLKKTTFNITVATGVDLQILLLYFLILFHSHTPYYTLYIFF